MSDNNIVSSNVTGREKVSDCLAAVRNAEEKASVIRRAAVADGAAIISDAERECSRMLAEARDNAEKTVSDHTADCERITKSKLSNETAKAERRANAITEKAMRNFDQAVERVVRGVIG